MDFSKTLTKEWKLFLQLSEEKIETMASLLLKIGDLTPSNYNLLFKPFSFSSPNLIKAIILGQNPYPTKNVANGLAFDINPGCKIPKSLDNILKKVVMEYGIQVKFSFISLEKWAKQGVLLLNIEPFLLNNLYYFDYFQVFLQMWNSILKITLSKYKDKPMIVWGNVAKNFLYQTSLFYKNAIYGRHPSPLSAHKGFFDINYFKFVNSKLRESSQNEIDWLSAISFNKNK